MKLVRLLLFKHMKCVVGISDIFRSCRSYSRGLPHATPNPRASIHKLRNQHSPSGSYWAKPLHIASLMACMRMLKKSLPYQSSNEFMGSFSEIKVYDGGSEVSCVWICLCETGS